MLPIWGRWFNTHHNWDTVPWIGYQLQCGDDGKAAEQWNSRISYNDPWGGALRRWRKWYLQGCPAFPSSLFGGNDPVSHGREKEEKVRSKRLWTPLKLLRCEDGVTDCDMRSHVKKKNPYAPIWSNLGKRLSPFPYSQFRKKNIPAGKHWMINY